MPDSKDTALGENTAPLGSDQERMIDDPAGTPVSQRIYKGSNNLEPDGMPKNYTIAVTVSSFNITVALKTKSGGNPSTTDPVSVWINGSYRRCTAALSVTRNAGTPWFGLSPECTATPAGFFVYLIWNTTPATDIMDIGFARKPYYRTFSEVSATTTNNDYCATGNGVTPTSTDHMINIGYFEATLGVTASYNWSVAAFTNSNLIQKPWNESRLVSWTPVITGYSANPTGTYKYRVIGREVWVSMDEAAGTSNLTTKTYTMPFTPSRTIFLSIPLPHNNGAYVAAGVMTMTPANNIGTFYLTGASAWTGSGAAMISNLSGLIPI